MAEQESRIEINQKYVIGIDQMNHTLYQQMFSKKKNKEYLKAIGYYPTMEKAMLRCRDEMFKDELFKKDTWTLDDAIALLVRVTNHLEAIVKHNFKGVTT